MSDGGAVGGGNLSDCLTDDFCLAICPIAIWQGKEVDGL